MSVNQVIGPTNHSIQKIGQKPQKAQDPANNQTSFMDVLRDKFSEVTAQMQPVPGMPGGVYSLNIDNIIPSGANDTPGQSVTSLI